MARQETILQVFVASPSDVHDERLALEEVVRELNLSWDRRQAVRLDLWCWEDNVCPGVGNDPQAVINAQAPPDFDIFVGILWARFGTPTPRALSGTEEEFNLALVRSQGGRAAPYVMVYFKDAPLPPSAIDPAQLAAVNLFKLGLGPKGVLYATFGSLENFKAQLRVHLRKTVQQWLGQNTAGAEAASSPAAPSALLVAERSQPEDDEGLLDLLERGSDALDRLTSVSSRMLTSINTLNERTGQRAAEMRALTASNDVTPHSAKRIAIRAAENLEDFVSQTNSDNPAFIEALRDFLEAFSRAASVSLDFRDGDTSHLSVWRDQVASMRSTLAGTREALKGLRDMISTAPRTTITYNRAKRRTIEAMDTTLAHFDEAIEGCGHAEETITGLLH